MGILNIDAYPCYWPEGWPRTKDWDRRKSNYKMTSLARCRDDIVRRAKLMHAKEVVISSNLPLRRDGLPLAGVSEPKDPAVAVYWAEYKGGKYQHRVVACDCWKSVLENMRAVNLTLDSLHQIIRTGATQVIEKAFTGLTALAASNPTRTWRDVFGWNPLWPVTREYIEQIYRALAAARHPDRGGSHEQMTELNVAREQALKEAE